MLREREAVCLSVYEDRVCLAQARETRTYHLARAVSLIFDYRRDRNIESHVSEYCFSRLLLRLTTIYHDHIWK